MRQGVAILSQLRKGDGVVGVGLGELGMFLHNLGEFRLGLGGQVLPPIDSGKRQARQKVSRIQVESHFECGCCRAVLTQQEVRAAEPQRRLIEGGIKRQGFAELP